MKSGALGKITSEVEIANISSHGIWLLSENQELFLSYDDFPWFKDVTIQQILNVEEPMPGHFYWPDLDVDLSIESIEHPERFPLKARTMDRGQKSEVRKK
ncbi:MAG: DUF2442 domain-containing protein [Deltaproteobacteria bacterium]|nr:DUF2442 domain-containing protein [Deltaproteobacteria bacterium]